MRPSAYAKLFAIARRECRDPSIAEDVVQEAMLAAVIAGRTDLNTIDTIRWLAGTVRNQARMAIRGAARRRRREGQWQASAYVDEQVERNDTSTFLLGLPPSLRILAGLTLSGHNRREIAYLLGTTDAALRQRVVALKRAARSASFVVSEDMPGLNLNIAYGRLRDALLPKLLRHGGAFASHDPDGHLIVVRSQKQYPRQHAALSKQEGLL
jgi:DNA-directed RNA polymerase specialized sigma24 family protein